MCKQFHTWMCSLNQEYRERASALRLRKIFSTASVQYRFLDPDPCLADFQRGKFWGSLGFGAGLWLLRALPVEARSVCAPPHRRSFPRRWFPLPAGTPQISAPFPSMLPGMRRDPRRDGLPEGRRGTLRRNRANPGLPLCARARGGAVAAPFRGSPRPGAAAAPFRGSRGGGTRRRAGGRCRSRRWQPGGGRFGAGVGSCRAPSIDDAVSRVSRGGCRASGSRRCHSLPPRSREGLPFPPSPTPLS